MDLKGAENVSVVAEGICAIGTFFMIAPHVKIIFEVNTNL